MRALKIRKGSITFPRFYSNEWSSIWTQEFWPQRMNAKPPPDPVSLLWDLPGSDPFRTIRYLTETKMHSAGGQGQWPSEAHTAGPLLRWAGWWEAHLGSVQLASGAWKGQAPSIALDLFCHLIYKSRQLTTNSRVQSIPSFLGHQGCAQGYGNCIAQEVEASVSWFLYMLPKERSIYPSYPLPTLLMDPVSASGSVQGAEILLWSWEYSPVLLI